MTIRALSLPSFLTFSLLALVGCGGGGGSTLPDPSVRVLNLSPGTTIDVAVDTNLRSKGVTYLQSVTTAFTESPDSYDISLRESGTGAALTAEAYTLVRDADYIVASVGLKDFGDESLKRLRALVFNYDRRVPNGTKARVIALHGYLAAKGSLTPSVQFRSPGDTPQLQFGTVAFGGLAVLDVDAGQQTIEARPDGAERTIASVTTTLLPGRIYIAALSGIDGGAGDSAPAVRIFEIPARP